MFSVISSANEEKQVSAHEINEKYLIKKENKKKGSLKMQRLIFFQKLL